MNLKFWIINLVFRFSNEMNSTCSALSIGMQIKSYHKYIYMTLLKHTTFMFAIFWPSVSIFSCTQLYFSTLKTKKPLPVHLNLKYLVEREKHLKTTLFLWFWFISEQGHFSKTLKESISLDMWLTLVWKQFWLKKITQFVL